MRMFLIAATGIGMIALPACNRPSVPIVGAENPTFTDPALTTEPVAETTPVYAESETLALAPGSTLRVRLLHGVDTERNRAGDRFTATLDEPLVSGDRVVVPKGTQFSGLITESKRSGRFKGRAVLALRLDSFKLRGRTYAVLTTPAARVSGGHKKRNWLWLSGGSGGGALIGAAVSGGSGALIGGGAGAAAGTVGMLFTGRKDVRLPVESTVTFTIQSRVRLT